MRLRAHPHLWVFLLYVLLSILMTYPLVFHMKAHLAHEADSYYMMWNLWWVKKALVDLKTNPFFCDYVFYPEGLNLIYQTPCFFSGLISLPIQLLFGDRWEGLVFSFNFLLLLSFVLGGFGVYLLVNLLTSCKRAAFISGLIFTFSPYHFIHLSHLNLVCLQWIPLYIWALVSLFRQKGYGAVFLSAIFLAITAYASETYLFYLLLFTALFVPYGLFSLDRGMRKVALLRVLALGAVALVLISPLAYLLIKEHGNYEKPLFGSTVFFSANPVFFFMPSKEQALTGQFFESVNRALSRNAEQNGLYLGYTPLFLLIFALLRGRKRPMGFWLLCGSIFLILSLGPYLHLWDKVFTQVKLPYYYAYHLFPFLQWSRTPLRFITLVFLCLSVIAGFGITEALKGLKDASIKAWLLLFILSLLIMVEFCPAPLSLASVRVPPFYTQLSRDEDDYSIHELPVGLDELGHYMFYQTVHHKRLIEAVYSRQPLHQSNRPLEAKGIKYVVLHKNFFPERRLFESFDQPFSLALKVFYENDELKVYEVNSSQVIPKLKFVHEALSLPDHQEALSPFLIGLALYREGRAQEAIERLQEALKASEGYLNDLVLLTSALAKQGSLEAQQAYEKAMEVTHLMAEAHYALGSIYYQRGSLDEAQHHIEKCLEIEPAHQPALKALQLIQEARAF